MELPVSPVPWVSWEPVCVVETVWVCYLINVFEEKAQKKMSDLDTVLK